MKTLLSLYLAFLIAPLATSSVQDVGPGFPKTMLKDVQWGALQAGDVVNIHGKPGGYHEKIEISGSGTAAAHIVIHGVPDPVTGALPVIDAKDAIEDPGVDFRNGISGGFGVIIVSPRATGYVYGTTAPSFIDIENLDIRNSLYTVDASISYTDKAGVVKGYNVFACGIYIEFAHDLAVRGCEISNCGNGIFANSKNGSAQNSARLLIEHNYFHDNSLPLITDPANPSTVISNGYGEHDCYIESDGVTYQYNHFGPMRANCHGVAIKERSAGVVIRYNEFDIFESSNVMALIDPQGGYGYLDTLPNYRDAYVYGNQITIGDYVSPISMVWWGAYNSTSSYPSEHRGTLYFFNNTIVNHHHRLALFFLPEMKYTGALPTYESVDCRNNIFFADTALMNATYEKMVFSTGGVTNGGGDINLNGPNWISPGWAKTAPNTTPGGALNGVNNLIVGNSQGTNNPMFVDVTSRDYHVLSGSNVLDAAGVFASSAIAAGHTDALEYLAPQGFQNRVQLGSAMDLGAVESSGTPPPPPPGGAISFSSAAYSVAENAGNAAITITRSGNATGAVSVVCTSSSGTASSPADFTASSVTLNWADGDMSSRTFTVPIVNDSSPEPAETVLLTLTNVSGGAAFGLFSQATLTIIDDDVAASRPIIAVTSSDTLIRFFSGSPGTLLGNVPITGMHTGEIIRGLALRHTTGNLYAVGAPGGTGTVTGTLYRLNPVTAALTEIAPLTLQHPSFDLGFDPATDQLHVFGSKGEHLRINADTGVVIATDTPFTYLAGDIHSGSVPGIVGADFTPGATSAAYAIDRTLDILARLGSNGQLSTIGLLGKDTEGLTGLDFATDGTGFAVLSGATDTVTSLYTIDITTGHATSLGTIGGGDTVRDLVVADPGEIHLAVSQADVTEGDGVVTLTAVRTGGSWGAVSVDFSTSDGTATAGSDYTATSGTLTWQDGATGPRTITIPIFNDTLVESDETLGLTMTNATNGFLLISPSSAVITIHERPYDAWKLENFAASANDPAVAGDLASPAADGIVNLLKYALGMNPHLAGPSGLPVALFPGGHLALGFTRAAADVDYVVETSDDLETWTSATTLNVTPPGSPAGWTVIEETAAAPRRFIHLRVTVP